MRGCLPVLPRIVLAAIALWITRRFLRREPLPSPYVEDDDGVQPADPYPIGILA